MPQDLWPPGETLDDRRRWWARRPGWRLRPSDSPTPHWFGRSSFEPPSCPACGHPITIWFDLEVASIPQLALSWERLPLLSCIDCMMWMYIHHYRIDEKARVITLLDVEGHSEPYEPFDVAAQIVPRPVRLEAIAQLDAPSFSTVGGRPYWYQRAGLYPTGEGMPCCRECGAPMIYVACRNDLSEFVRTPADDFDPYQYHFACDRCGVLTVLSHWS
jgi:hypothetical protein